MAEGDMALKREVTGTVIPAGYGVTLPAGTAVRLQQTLGGAFTVISEQAGMVRIEGRDADALGLEPPPQPEAAPVGGGLRERVMGELRNVYDPEIPVNIVDLGLIYGCDVADIEGGANVTVRMTMTAPGCGMGTVLAYDAERRIRALPGVKEAKVLIVWDPPWHRGLMSEAARLELGLM